MLATSVAGVSAAVFVAGCGGGERQDKGERAATYKVEVTGASFKRHQRLAETQVMRITVRNAGRETIPNVAVSVTNDDAAGGAGFTTRSEAGDMSDPTQRLWIVDKGPPGADTAYVSTWALGPLAGGQSKTFRWIVTPVVAGTHSLRWHVAAGLNGKAIARTADGHDAAGTFKVTVTRKPREAGVDPATGQVVDLAP